LQPLLKLYIMKITHMLSLGKSYAFTLCIFLFSTFIFGQTQLVNFPFTGNTLTGGMTYESTLQTAPPTIGYYNSSNQNTTPLYNSSRVQAREMGDYLEIAIDTRGFSNISLDFDAFYRYTALIGTGTWSVSYSTTNGGNFQNLSSITISDTSLFHPGESEDHFSDNLPTSANNNQYLRIRIKASDFSILGTSYLYIDNINIKAGNAIIGVFSSANVNIPHESVASYTYDTDFGTVQTSTGSTVKTYTIKNTGSVQLNITSIVSMGQNAEDFTVSGVPTSVPSNQSRTFTVTFDPSNDGIRTSDIVIYSNSAPNPYTFNVQGRGVSCALTPSAFKQNSFGAGTPSLPTTGNYATATGNSTSSYRPANTPMYFNNGQDTRSWLINHQASSLEFGPLDISNEKNVSISFNIAAFGTSSSEGVDKGSTVVLSVWNPLTNQWSEEMRLFGSTNSYTKINYPFFDGQAGLFEVLYDGNNLAVEKTNSGNAGQTSGKIGTFKLNIPATFGNQLKFKINATTSGSTRLWLIDEVKVNSENAIFKKYTAAGQWEPAGMPTENQKIIIEGNFTVPVGGLSVCECEVAQNGSLNIPENSTLTVRGKIINHNSIGENFVVQNNANLYQIESEAANVGKITVFRKSEKMVRQDATFWSSPVSGQNLRSFSPNTLLKRFYLYNKYSEAGATSDYKSILEYDSAYPMPNPIPQEWFEDGEVSGNVFNPATYTFKKGWGYTIRVANNWTSSAPGAEYEGRFVGTPHNGDVEVPVYGKFTVVGNPYPSNISYHAFMDFNPDVNSIHFWTHKFPVGSDYYDYGYLTVNKMGTTGLYPNPEGGDSISVNYNATIKVGQGFLVRNSALANTQTEWLVKFNNLMRIPSTGGVFYKNFDEPEAHKFWLGLYDQQGEKMAQILLGYMEGATNGFDKQYDAERMGSSPLYSLMDEGKMAIQARALPFNHADVILLGFVAKNTGSFRITLDDMTGLFAEGQEILLKDKVANIVHNLSLGDYTFDANQGTYNHRFEIIYKKKPSFIKSLSSVNKIEINKINHYIEINSSIDKITSIQLYNISGRLLMDENNINKLNYSIQTTGFEPSIIVVRGFTETGETFNQKFIIN
jgi:hypothetical protein